MALTTHTPSSVEVKERVELYLYSPLGLRGVLKGELYCRWYMSRDGRTQPF